MSASDQLTVNAPPTLRGIRALLFDAKGTCTIWYTPVAKSLVENTPSSALSASTFTASERANGDWATLFAHHSRKVFFDLVSELTAAGKMPPSREDFRAALKKTTLEYKMEDGEWIDAILNEMFKQWRMTEAFEDSASGLKLLRKKYILAGLSNATTSMSIQVYRHNDLTFDVIICSDMVHAYKPDPRVYDFSVNALAAKSDPGEVAMVASHSYELEAAKKHGMKTIYISRDLAEDLTDYKFDLVVREGGLVQLAKILGCDD